MSDETKTFGSMALPDLENLEFDEPYGYELQLDLYGCDHTLITNPDALRLFVSALVAEIGMIPYGEFECPHFGHTSPKTSGLSFKQWIETSLISGHISEARDTVYLNVFSCVFYDQEAVVRFAVAALKAGTYRKNWTIRY